MHRNQRFDDRKGDGERSKNSIYGTFFSPVPNRLKPGRWKATKGRKTIEKGKAEGR
jgi:hypothetical protein